MGHDHQPVVAPFLPQDGDGGVEFLVIDREVGAEIRDLPGPQRTAVAAQVEGMDIEAQRLPAFGEMRLEEVVAVAMDVEDGATRPWHPVPVNQRRHDLLAAFGSERQGPREPVADENIGPGIGSGHRGLRDARGGMGGRFSGSSPAGLSSIRRKDIVHRAGGFTGGRGWTAPL
jgi:hypothetical protein